MRDTGLSEIFRSHTGSLIPLLPQPHFHATSLDAVKAGDSGRVLLVLKIWALSFRGNGRTKYGYEMLHVIHNLTNVFPEATR